MTNEQPRQKQATWKTLLIIGIVAAVVWFFTAGRGSDNMFDLVLAQISGLVALIGLLGGLILRITASRN